MKYYFLITGILCVIYYLILVWYSRKLRSTFAVFWLMTGGVHLILGCAPLHAYMYTILSAVCLAAWISILSVELRIIRAMFGRCDCAVDWIIVLGAQVKGTKITDSLRRRLDTAVAYLRRYPRTRVIVSGGQGPGEDISEADAMAGYLEEKGIAAGRIFREDASTSTRENLRFCRRILDAHNDRVGIVTNGFHIYRASVTAAQEGYRYLYKIPASSNPVFHMNYLAREFFAVAVMWLRGAKG